MLVGKEIIILSLSFHSFCKQFLKVNLFLGGKGGVGVGGGGGGGWGWGWGGGGGGCRLKQVTGQNTLKIILHTKLLSYECSTILISQRALHNN